MPGQRGHGEHRRVGEEREAVGDVDLRLGPAFGVEEVPLVEDDDDGGAGGVDPLGQALVLVADAFVGVDDEQRGVGAVDGLERAHEAVVLGRLVDLAAAAHAGGVDEAQRTVVGLDDGVDCVACRARHVVHDRALVADQAVEQRRLADVGSPDDGDGEDPVVVGVLGSPPARRQRRDQCVEQVATPPAVDRRHRVRVRRGRAGRSSQVSCSRRSSSTLLATRSTGLSLRCRIRGDLRVLLGDADVDVDDHEDHVGVAHRLLGLPADLTRERLRAVTRASARASHPVSTTHERAAVPVGFEHLAGRA